MPPKVFTDPNAHPQVSGNKDDLAPHSQPAQFPANSRKPCDFSSWKPFQDHHNFDLRNYVTTRTRTRVLYTRGILLAQLS